MASTALDDYCTSPFKTFLSFFTSPGFGLRYKAFLELDKLTVSFNKDVRNHKKKIKEIEAEKPVEGKMPYLIDKKFQALKEHADVLGCDLKKNVYVDFRMNSLEAMFCKYKPSPIESLVSLLPGTNAYNLRKAADELIDQINSNLKYEHDNKPKEEQAGEVKINHKYGRFFDQPTVKDKRVSEVKDSRNEVVDAPKILSNTLG